MDVTQSANLQTKITKVGALNPHKLVSFQPFIYERKKKFSVTNCSTTAPPSSRIHLKYRCLFSIWISISKMNADEEHINFAEFFGDNKSALGKNGFLLSFFLYIFSCA